FHLSHASLLDIYSLSLHDALPIFSPVGIWPKPPGTCILKSSTPRSPDHKAEARLSESSAPSTQSCLPNCRGISPTGNASQTRSSDRKSTRLNSSHVSISYAVFCLT